MIQGRKIDSIIVDDFEDSVAINQKRKNPWRMEDVNAPFSHRWEDAESRGYNVYRGKRRWRLTHKTEDKYVLFSRVAAKKKAGDNGRRDPNYEFGTNPCGEIILMPNGETIKQLAVETIIKQAKLQKHMTYGAIKRAALDYALAHEVMLRIKNGLQQPSVADTSREKAKEALGVWFAKTVDRAAFERLYLGTPVAIRDSEDGEGAPHVEVIPVHDFYHRGEDASVDGAEVSGETPKRRTPLFFDVRD